ncbi:MAG: D-alanyl-D-alanine carboxypeptidase [Defluviitaleaceae bacterium]|nr:D-alanyl-D-alanine carboxypeptidase [Defluviitaleaceae bacterium]
MKIFALCMAMAAMGAVAEIKLPNVEAAGAVLVEAESGRILWGKDEQTPLAMASTTKIMTALMVLEHGGLDDMVTVSKRAAAAPKVKMFLEAGEQIKLEDLLYALMLQSSNDAAVAIAEHISGTVEDFCSQMTAKAYKMGAVHTIFETASGLDKGEHQSTAADLALITRYALENPDFVSLIATPAHTATSNRKTYAITNKNRLLNEYSGAMGVKTGYTNKAGHCFVGAAERDGMQLISVVLASGWGNRGKEQKWVDTKRLLNYGFDNFEMEEIVAEGDAAGVMEITRTRTPQIPLYYGGSITIPVRIDGEDISLIPHFPVQMPAPVEAGVQVGEGRLHINGEYFATIPIYTAQSASRHDFKTSLEKVLKAFFQLGTSQEVEIVLPEL